METDERAILAHIATTQDRIDYINELTGVFSGVLSNMASCNCMLTRPPCNGPVTDTQTDRHLCVTPHMRLVGDLLNLRMANYAQRLVSYRWYHYMMGNYLPGDITCFDELTRIVPNTYVTYKHGRFEVTRFYPKQSMSMCSTDEEYWEAILAGRRINDGMGKYVAEN